MQGERYSYVCCEIDEHRMIILGGWDDGNELSSGFIYDARTKQSTPLPNDMPAARYGFSAIANKRYMYVIGGGSDVNEVVNTIYPLSFETYEWTTMAPMGTVRSACAGMLLGDTTSIFLAVLMVMVL